MKKAKIVIALSALVLSGCTVTNNAGIGGNNNEVPGPTQNGTNGTMITKETLHEGVYNVTNSNNVFYDGTLHYKLITKANETNLMINRSVGLIPSQILSCLGVQIETSYDESVDLNEKLIIVNRPDLMAANNVQINSKIENAKVGYQVTSVNNSVFIYGTNSEALRLAIIRFLSFTIGYDCLGENIFIYERDGEVVNSNSNLLMPDFHIVEKPDYEYRAFTSVSNDNEAFYMGFSDVERISLAAPGGFHNSVNTIIPKSVYGLSHPEFYDSSKQHICYTAGGNKTSYNLMVSIAAKNLTDFMFTPANMEKDYVSFCHEDVTANGKNWCTCSACTSKIRTLSPNNRASVCTYIPFMNDVAEAFDQQVTQKCTNLGIPKRNIQIWCLVYHQAQSLTAPDEVIDELKFDDRIKVLVAPIQFKYDRHYTDPSNSYCKEQVEKWAKFSNNIGTWTYSVNFKNYLCPYNTYDTMIDYYRFFYNNGSTFMLNEGNWTEPHVSHFTAFKDYIDSKCLIDLSVNYSDLETRFFKYFFGDAGNIMKSFYKEIVHNCIDARKKNLTDGGIKSENASYYSLSALLRFADYIDQAYDAIEPVKYANNDLYNALKLNVQVEGVFPHYLLTTKAYEDYLSKEVLNKYRRNLYDESCSSGINEIYENGPKLSDICFSEWGF